MHPDVSQFVGICKAACAGDNTHTRTLTERELGLLLLAADAGDFTIVRVDGVGVGVTAGGLSFVENATEAMQYRDAFLGLCQRKLVSHRIENSFRLTTAGIAQAQKLTQTL